MRRPEACGDGDVDLAMEKRHEHVQKMCSDEREQERGKRGTKGRRSGPALRFTGGGCSGDASVIAAAWGR